MRPADIGELVEVSDPRVSPDGRTIAFVVTTVDLDANRYRGRVWLAAADGSEPPRPFTAGEHRDGRPRWSPDGRALAFVSHREEQGSELYVLPVAGGGELRRVASWPEEIEELAWSPDGRRLAFTARRRDDEPEGTRPDGNAERRPHEDSDRPPRRIDRLAYRFDGMGWTCDRPRQLFTVRADGSARPAARHERRLRPCGGCVVAGRRRGWRSRRPPRHVGPRPGRRPVHRRRRRGRAPAADGDGPDLSRPVLVARRLDDRVRVGRPALAARAARRSAWWSRRRRAPAAHDRARPQLRAVPRRRARAGVGRRRSALPGRGLGQPAPLPRRRRAAPGSPSSCSAATGGSRGSTSPAARSRSARRRATAPSELFVLAGDEERRLTQPRSRSAGGAGTGGARALHRDLARRHRGGGVGDAPRRVRGRRAVPDAAQRPRRPVRPVRQPSLRRVPDPVRRRLRRALRQPAGLVGVRRRVGSRRSAVPTSTKIPARAGAASTTTT